jgi:hypothetical protein
VAEKEDGTVVEFVIGERYTGEYGISLEKVPWRPSVLSPITSIRKDMGKQLIDEFMDHLKALGVQKMDTLVDENDSKLTHFLERTNLGRPKR